MVLVKCSYVQILIMLYETVSSESKEQNKQTINQQGNFPWKGIEIENYKTKQPFCEGNKTQIEVAIIPLGIPDINIEKLTLTLDFYVQLAWVDCRLTNLLPNSEKLKVPPRIAKKLWTPSVIISNGIKTEPIVAVFSQLEKTKMKLENHFFSFLKRKDETFYCVFDLSAYPMDTQHCEMHIEIVDDDDERNLDLIPSKMKLPSINSRSPPQFSVKEVGLRDVCNTDNDYFENNDCVAFYVVLKRELPFYLIVTYFPSALIVILSWVSFWLDVDASAPRVTLGLTSLLTLSTQFAGIQKNLPPVSYIKAIDLWMFCCMFMIFCSLLEFALVNYQYREKKKLETKETPEKRTELPKISKTNKVYVFHVSPKQSVTEKQPLVDNNIEKEEKRSIPKIEKLARICFPLFFLLFNIVYWSYYLSGY